MIFPGGGPITDAGGPVAAGAPPPPTGQAILPVRIAVGDPGQASLPVRVSVVPAALVEGSETVTDGGLSAAIWGLVVEVDGNDVSDQVVGEVVVEAEESAARIADFTLHHNAGTVISPTTWTGRGVHIWLADLGSGSPASALLLFSGIVDLPSISLSTRLLALRCTDNRQGVIGGLTRDAIDAMLPGSFYSPVVFSGGAPALAYANDRISTVPLALDLAPTGNLRATAWVAKPVADMNFGEDVVLDGSVAVDVVERRQLVNQIAINFGYRFPRIKAEGYALIYDLMALHATSFVYWVRDGNSFLQRAAVVAAIEQAGGTIVSVTWTALPTTAQIIPGTAGVPAGAWLPNPATDVLFCLGFSAVVSFDYAQQIEETHEIIVSNAASVAALGAVRSEMHGALEGVYDDTVAVEQHIRTYRQQETTLPPKNVPPVVVGMTNSVNGTLTAESDRAAAEAAMTCLIAIARTRIHASHRQHTISASVPCNPAIDVDKTVAIDANGVVAKGKVRRVVHRLDPDSGSAISAFELAVCAVAGIGVTHADDAIAAPEGTSAGTSNTLAEPVITFNGLVGEDNVITIEFPGVEEAERAKAAIVIETAHAAPLFEDLMEVTL